MKVAVPEMDAAKAHQEFSELVADQATTCLWFMQAPQTITVLEPAAEMVLKAIVRHGTRPAWQRAKALQTWRFLNIK